MKLKAIILSILCSLCNENYSIQFNAYAVKIPSDKDSNKDLNTELNKIANKYGFKPIGGKHITLLSVKISSEYAPNIKSYLEDVIRKRISKDFNIYLKNPVLKRKAIENFGDHIVATFSSADISLVRKQSFDLLRSFFRSLGLIEQLRDKGVKGIWYTYFDPKTGIQMGELLDSFVPHVSFIYNSPTSKIPEAKLKQILNEKLYYPFVAKAQFDISEKTLNMQPMQISVFIAEPNDVFTLSNRLNTLASL